MTKIGRCGRNPLDFLKLEDKFFKKLVAFISLDLLYSNDITINELIVTNLADIATFVNEELKDSQKQAILTAKK